MSTTTLKRLPSTPRPFRLPLGGDRFLLALSIVCGLLALLAVFGPLLAPYPPAQTDILAAGQGPTGAHLLGTDSLGRDILSRLLAGARLSFAGPGIIVLVSSVLGTAVAVTSAWIGGAFDSAVKRVLNVVFAVPGILVAVLAVALFGRGFTALVIALSLIYTPYVARVVRSVAATERRRPYIEALQLAGLSGWRICTRHILRNVLPIVLAQATIGFGSALMDFGAMSFLGLGVQPPSAEWGLMVSDGRSEILDGALQQSLWAGTMIVVTVVCFNILGARISSKIGAKR
ncbi:ABC transporter permease [Streptomyces sp. HC44]|uniref:ABC transporter permease n=1 Tax=Streptomyces scabichelini TaxID=2711217 RepID=A0A6G4VBS8_9ACTN|nr:ABC transporter permease [Streptomyces scabichelini]NGO11355.1 ABC transporter permease [Streptomyces scabichelini]